jgi:hypothetical protein
MDSTEGRVYISVDNSLGNSNIRKVTQSGDHNGGNIVTKLILASVCLLLSIPAFAQNCPVPDKSKTKKTDPIPLCMVAQKIKKALDDYNADPTTEKGSLPKLSKAEFDFKVVRSTSGGLKFSILVFSVGATTEIDATDDVTFSYEVPKPTQFETESVFEERIAKDHDFSKELIDTIKAAAEQLKATQAVGDAKFKTLTINLAYGVKWDFTVGATVPIQLVTIGGNFDHNKTSTQTVKLTFGQ